VIFVPTTTLPLITTDFAACCSPVTDGVLDETAERLGRVFEALGEPTLVRRQSTIAATSSGEAHSRFHAVLGSVTVGKELLHCHELGRIGICRCGRIPAHERQRQDQAKRYGALLGDSRRAGALI
jgi:hypothetical protein